MRNFVFWLLVVMAAWAPMFSLGYYVNGGQEDRLDSALSKMTRSGSFARRCLGGFLHLLMGKISRWVFSVIGFLGLFIAKLGSLL
ncbi:hypothetical protein [Ramlibacter sp. 2FC]|uniref:hypothetical protein n=1 Tax=Ramlibacter sp. 2FC TaxID=2502188 RepID=UPI0010F83643|nr:hypothetical protein [Ramlibacter sp. 2FC]